MSKNQKVAKYLREQGIKHDWNSEYLYLISKTLSFQLWDIKQSWSELINTILKIFKK